MSSLYVNEQGAVLGLEGGYFQVKLKDGTLRKIPKETLESVTVFGNITITTPCYRECLQRGIPVNYFSSSGAYFGKLSSTRHENPFRLKKQIYMTDDSSFCLALSKKIIHAKISNQLVLLRRYKRSTGINIEKQIQRIEIARKKIAICSTIEMLMGYEGSAAREYFSALSDLVNPDFHFEGRKRQPPTDPFNSMLSLGYTMLMYEVYNELESRGLSPYLGFMHAMHEKHPTLASDMMEEWRAVIVDSVVMSLIQGHEIKVSHFEQDEETNAVYLTRDGMKIFVSKIERKFQSSSNYLCSEQTTHYFRRGIYLQSVALTKAIEERNVDVYTPLYIR